MDKWLQKRIGGKRCGIYQSMAEVPVLPVRLQESNCYMRLIPETGRESRYVSGAMPKRQLLSRQNKNTVYNEIHPERSV